MQLVDDTIELRLGAAEQLLELAAAIGRAATLEEALDQLFESFRDLVPYDRMEYASITDDGRTLLTRWVRARYTPVLLTGGFAYRRSAGSPDSSFVRSGSVAPYIETDTLQYASSQPPGHPSRLLLEEGIRSGLCCPLLVDGRRVGYLFFCSRAPGAYEDFHLWVMSRIAGVAAAAITTVELREELAERNRQLEEMETFRTRYLAAVSHELRTPITAIVGLAGAMQERLEDFEPDELRELVLLLAEQSADTADIVEDLLILARAEMGVLEVASEEVDLSLLAKSVAASIAPGAEIRGDGRALADPGRVRQILRNLLSNACKYGGPSITIEIAETSDGAVIEVADDGLPIPPSVREQIFQPFVSSGSASDSVGIGLWVSYELALRMGGGLTYEHSEGHSRFALSLPSCAS